MFGLEAVMAIGGLILPPVVDFIKGKFLKGSGDPKDTLATLAVTKPEQLAPYTQAYAAYLTAETAFYNRDVVNGGKLGEWVCNLRAAIRPIGVIICFVLLGADAIYGFDLTEGARGTLEMVITSWFGTRITSK